MVWVFGARAVIAALVVMMGLGPQAQAQDLGVHAFAVKTIDGTERQLSDYKGKVLLIVNTASRCGFTPQYAGLERLQERYGNQGFFVLAFPSNDFLGQEPGTDAEIKKFCQLRFNTSFPLFSKISVRGEGMAPLYRYLTRHSSVAGDISWNFNKFLIGRDGQPIARFGSRVDPQSPELVDQIEKALRSPA